MLKQVRSKRGTLAARTRDALFSLFGQADLPPINTNSDPTEISKWKQKPEVASCYEKLFKNSTDDENSLLYISCIIGKVLNPRSSIAEKAFVIVICINMLNPKHEQIKLEKRKTKRQVSRYIVSL